MKANRRRQIERGEAQQAGNLSRPTEGGVVLTMEKTNFRELIQVERGVGQS